MKKNKVKKYGLLIITLAVMLVIIFAFIFYVQKTATTKHVSEDLKIAFNYPKGWYIDDRDFNLLITNYSTSLNEDINPSQDQLELFIKDFNGGCHSTIEENLIDPACGERRESNEPYKIILKEKRKTPGGTFYKYVTQSPEGNKTTFYLLQDGERVLQISKEPDPSNFEKEFEEIVNSIQFQ